MHVSRDGGKTWTNVTPKAHAAIRAPCTPSSLRRTNPRRAFVAASRYLLDDFQPVSLPHRRLRSDWTLLTDGTTASRRTSSFASSAKIPAQGIAVRGTEFGMYVSLDDGTALAIAEAESAGRAGDRHRGHDADLVLSTNGRSFWILDDVTPLREMAAGAASTRICSSRATPIGSRRRRRRYDQPYVGGPAA